jgi:dipeptidyl aminopeptidase/acylaminoacyl peptidase
MKRAATLISTLLVCAAACGGGGQGTKATGPIGAGTTGDDAPAPGGGDPGAPPAVTPPVRAQGTPSTDVIDRDVLFGNPERATPQLSPDGKLLAWLAPKDGVMNVYVAPAGDLTKAEPVTADPTRPVRTYFWAYDNKHLLYMQDEKGDENFHVWRVSLADKKVVDLTPVKGARAKVIGMSWKQPNTIIASLNDRDPRAFDVWSIAIDTGERTKLFENTAGLDGFQVDHDLALRFATSPLPDGGFTIHAYDAKAKAWSEYETIPTDDTMTTQPVGFTRKGDARYVIDSRGRDTGALYLADIKTKQKKLLHEDARTDVGGVMLSPRDSVLQAVSVNYDRQKWIPIDPKVKADFAGIAKLAPGDFQVTSRTLDDKTWVVAIYGDRVSTSYYTWDRTKKKGALLFTARPELEGKPLVPMHPVEIESRDGLTLVSYLSLPASADADADGKADKPVPTVLLVHGGPWGRDGWGFNAIHQLLANRGYGVLSVNFRGSTGFGKKFVNAGNGQWGKKMHDDLIDATQWLIDQGVAPKDKVCIMGGSYGGYSTLAGLTLTPEVFACGVDIVGPSNIITLLESIPPYWTPMIASFKARIGDWTTPEGKAALLEVSPLTHARKIKRPLLIGQGAHDPRVKQAESDQIVKAMQGLGIPVTYAVFPDEGHGFARPQNNLVFFAVAEAFLSAHLGGVYQPLSKEDVAASTIRLEAGAEGIPGWPLL